MSIQPKERLLSLDAFRGLTIASMILVNNPGSWQYLFKPLGHADWHGWTPTDWIFPFFLFIMGTAMAYSFGKKLEKGMAPEDLVGKVIRRTIIIFAIGLFLNFNSSLLRVIFNNENNGFWGTLGATFSQIRIMGVLPRIALCYFAASLIVLFCKRTTQYLWIVILFGVYTFILVFIPMPGESAYELARGRNIVYFIDYLILGDHMWQTDIEPEGILSTLPAIVSVLLGYFSGEWIRSGYSRVAKLTGLMVAGFFIMMQGYLWHDYMPINKPLWTVTYTLFTGGLALQFLGACYFLIDIQGIKKWATPFLAYGSNAIVVFAGSSYVAATVAIARITVGDETTPIKTFIHENLFVRWFEPLNESFLYHASFLYSVFYMLLWGIIAYILYRKKIFIKV